MSDEPRYIVREKLPRDESGAWWEVYDTVKPSWPAIVGGKSIYRGRDKARVQADADWLNSRG